MNPFELELEVLEPEEAGPRLHAIVKNVAKTGKRILVDNDIQPIGITLTGPGGTKLTPFDERTRKKFDTTRHKYLFRVLGPSSEWVAREDEFHREDGAWRLRFGNFTFSGLKAGTYKARLSFTSEGREWSEKGQRGEYEDLWEGSIESPEVEIALP